MPLTLYDAKILTTFYLTTIKGGNNDYVLQCAVVHLSEYDQ